MEADDRRSRRRALTALCGTEIISWGVLYYAFPVSLTAITSDTGWSASAASAAFSAGLVASAVAGVAVGRWLDRRGPRIVMTGGSALGVVGLVGVALAPTLAWFTVAWLLAGSAMAATLYQPAFAALTRWYGPDRMRAMTTLTLAGGLASTVFAPITAALLERMSWRSTYLVLAGVVALTVLVHAVALTPPWTRVAATPKPAEAEVARRPRLPPAVRGADFLTLAAGFTVLAFGFYVTIVTVILLLTERGFDHALAATTLGLLGAGQLLGRVVYGPLAHRTSAPAQLVAVVLTGVLAVVGLALAPAEPAVLIAFAVLLGAARGAFTLLQAAVVADRWGHASYGTHAGIFTAPVTTATALAPWAGVALAGLVGGYREMFLWAAVGIAATASVGLTLRSPVRTSAN